MPIFWLLHLFFFFLLLVLIFLFLVMLLFIFLILTALVLLPEFPLLLFFFCRHPLFSFFHLQFFIYYHHLIFSFFPHHLFSFFLTLVFLILVTFVFHSKFIKVIFFLPKSFFLMLQILIYPLAFLITFLFDCPQILSSIFLLQSLFSITPKSQPIFSLLQVLKQAIFNFQLLFFPLPIALLV